MASIDPSLPPLSERIVPSDFPRYEPCRLAFVGEAPGDREVERGQPFIGPSGNTFNAMLRAAGIDRSLCYVGNVFSTKLEDNSMVKEKRRRGDGWKVFWERNIERLTEELSQVRPTVVVPLGGTALLALAGTGSISHFRGNAMYGTGDFSQYKLVPTFHPAMILRQWKYYSVCIGDLLKAVKQAEAGPTIEYPRRVLNISPSIEEVEAYLRGPCTLTNLLSCDIETGWGQVRGVSFAPNEYEAIYVPFISLDKLNRSYWPTAVEEKRALLAVKACLESETPKLGQNFANYDIQWLLTKLGIKVRNFQHDLRLLHKTLYPELPGSLEFMGSAYSGQGNWKQWGRQRGHKGSEDDKRDA